MCSELTYLASHKHCKQTHFVYSVHFFMPESVLGTPVELHCMHKLPGLSVTLIRSATPRR